MRGQDGRGSPTVSIVVVLYNSGDYIGACIESLAGLDYRPLELVMVDNASSDDSAKKARESAARAGVPCVVSRERRNIGFAAANNRGAELARGEFLLMLNPDTEVYPDTVTALVDALDRDDGIGLAGCKLLYPDRATLQHAGGFVRDNGLTMHYGTDTPDEGGFDERRDVAYVTGAAIAMRRERFFEVGMFDEGYFPAYFEETDLCFRMRRSGYRVTYVPEARVIHHESTTTGKYSKRFLYLYHRNRVRFLLKSFSWGFLLERTLPFERQWREWIPETEMAPLKRAYLVNALNLPRTLLARLVMERSLALPRIEDTVTLEETRIEIGMPPT